MNELLYYGGIVFTLLFFVSSVVLFFLLKIPRVFQFYMGNRGRRPLKNQYKTASSSNTSRGGYDGTALLEGDETQLLDMAQNFATVLLGGERDDNLDE